MSGNSRVVALVDMDCFYCQVEEKLNPSLQGKPVGVIQYNLWRDGGVIAVNYLAKGKGVTKGMWMSEAKKLCPEIVFARVAELRGRADLTKYRDAGKEVADVLSGYTNIMERASIDEAYLDLTDAVESEIKKGISKITLQQPECTHVVGHETSNFYSNINMKDYAVFHENDQRLAIGGMIVEKIRASVYEKTGYRCSAGIAHNKILAKLVCGLHKPNKQTILPHDSIAILFSDLPLRKIKGLGGKFGKRVEEELDIKLAGELLQFSEKDLARRFDQKTSRWLHNIARGIDEEPVQAKLIAKSIGCSKRFPFKNALTKQKDIEHWINELAVEVVDRLEKDLEENNRRARTMIVSFTHEINNKDVANTKTCSLKSYESTRIAKDMLEVIEKFCKKPDGSYNVKLLGISTGNFDNTRKVRNIKNYFEETATNNKHGEKTILPEHQNEERPSFSEKENMVTASLEDENNDSDSVEDNTSRNAENYENLESFPEATSTKTPPYTDEGGIHEAEDSRNDVLRKIGFTNSFFANGLNRNRRTSANFIRENLSFTSSQVKRKRDLENSFFFRYFKKRLSTSVSIG